MSFKMLITTTCICATRGHKSGPKFSGSQHEKRNLISHSIHSVLEILTIQISRQSLTVLGTQTRQKLSLGSSQIGGAMSNDYNFLTIHTTRSTGLLIKMTRCRLVAHAQTQYREKVPFWGGRKRRQG